MKQHVTVIEHILQHQGRMPMATGRLTRLLNGLILAAKIISREVTKAGLVDVLGMTGDVNVQGSRSRNSMILPTGSLFTGCSRSGYSVPCRRRKTLT